MKRTPVTRNDLQRSVIAVPPLALSRDGHIDHQQNRALVAHLEAGGVSTVLYGGNANVYNIGIRAYCELLEALPEWADAETWVIPSVGPSYGRLLEHVDVVRELDYPTAMALPLSSPATASGTATGLRKASERLGKPLMLYLKWDGYLPVELVRAMVDDGLVCAIKYAIVREEPSQDDYLRDLLEVVDPSLVVSGIGERPAMVHLREFGLPGFTSGSVCIGPRQSSSLLEALQGERYEEAATLRERFLPLEDLRDGINPIRVLHDAVTEAEVANMGPILPLLSNLEPDERRRVRNAAWALRAEEPVVPT